MSAPPPAAVRGNDWRSLAVAPIEVFEPRMTATVVVPYYEAPGALALTLAGLEGQTYPRELFEVIVVDDGSDPPPRAVRADSAPAAGGAPGGLGLRPGPSPQQRSPGRAAATSSPSWTAT